MHSVINRVLFLTIICGIVLFVIKIFITKPDELAIKMLFLFLFSVACINGFIKITENFEKVIKRQKAAMIKFVYSSEEALTNAAKDRIKFSKIIMPILLAFLTIAFLIMFVIKLITKIKEGLLFYSEYTFIIGMVLFIFSVIIIILGIVKKERVFENYKIRKYAYVYLNILVSLMLIAK